jgi:hypothetical protein
MLYLDVIFCTVFKVYITIDRTTGPRKIQANECQNKKSSSINGFLITIELTNTTTIFAPNSIFQLQHLMK